MIDSTVVGSNVLLDPDPGLSTPCFFKNRQQAALSNRSELSVHRIAGPIVVLEVNLLSSGSSPDHTNARGQDDGGDDFPHYAQYAQGEITRAEVPY
jgi:hypothetical protein